MWRTRAASQLADPIEGDVHLLAARIIEARDIIDRGRIGLKFGQLGKEGRALEIQTQEDPVKNKLQLTLGAPNEIIFERDFDAPLHLVYKAMTNAELSRALGRVLRRPAVLPVPAFALKALYGEMAEVVIAGSRVLPERLLDAGHTFTHPELEPALRAALAP